MYITINDIIGEARINLSYPIKGKESPEGTCWQGPTTWSTEIEVVSMLNDIVQYWLQGYIEVLLKTGKKIVLNKAVYTDKELNALIGLELKSQMMDSRNDVLRTNKSEKVTKLTISLNKLDNSENLEDRRPSNTLFTYYVTGPEYSMRFKPHTPQYEKLKNGTITSLTLKITDQAGKVITDGPGTTVVLHIQ